MPKWGSFRGLFRPKTILPSSPVAENGPEHCASIPLNHLCSRARSQNSYRSPSKDQRGRSTSQDRGGWYFSQDRGERSLSQDRGGRFLSQDREGREERSSTLSEGNISMREGSRSAECQRAEANWRSLSEGNLSSLHKASGGGGTREAGVQTPGNVVKINSYNGWHLY